MKRRIKAFIERHIIGTDPNPQYSRLDLLDFQARGLIETVPGVPDERMWGTDCWGDILSEPTEDHARSVAQSSKATLYSRLPHCAWVREDTYLEGEAA